MPACATCGLELDQVFRFCPECGADLPDTAQSREQRKVVTIVFCDLTGSTALGESLDPEQLRAVLARYFEAMKRIVELHGGTVEKFIGDAVMAVFGVPSVHEDDALRAVRAAVEMRDALPGLGLRGRIGVMTGEVVTGTDERLVTGDAVNVAARLEQAAEPGAVLIGQPTLRLVSGAVEVEKVDPLALKGKSDPVAAFRLLAVRDAPERPHDTPFIGRDRELALVHEAWARAQDEQSCVLVTIVGDAGVGKSRLVWEALRSVSATIARGRCPPYGNGNTYWPVVEILKQLDILPADETAAATIRSLLGEGDTATSGEEIAGAVRKTLEQAAARRPLVVVFDDIQLGEQTFHELVEHVALLSTGFPLLLLCMARPELAERNPTWPVDMRLTPLGDDDVEALIPAQIDGDLRVTIARAAGGNPLYVAEMLAMAAETDGAVIVPPTLQALLAARLDQLDLEERQVLEWAAIEGEVFHRGAIQALAPDETPVTPRLAALVRKQVIRPDRPLLAGEDGFRFRHLLLRDTAYEALPKAARAELHRSYAAWLERNGTELVELDELLGYHLEVAFRYSAELGRPAEEDLASSARRHLAAAGRRSKLQSDVGAAVKMLERATALVPPGEADAGLEAELSDSLFSAGKGEEALWRARALTERAVDAGDRAAELCWRIRLAMLGAYLDEGGASESLAPLVEEALPLFEAADDDVALYITYQAVAEAAFATNLMDASLEAYERAAAHGAKAGLSDDFLGWRGLCRLYGTTPVPEMLTWLDENEPRSGRDHWLRAARAVSFAQLGRFDEARAILAQTRAELADFGGGIQHAVLTGLESAMVELLAADPGAAAEFGAEGCSLLEALGDVSFLSTAASLLGQSFYELDRLEDADEWAGRGAELGAPDDLFTQMTWRQVLAKVRARRGEHVEAERLAREAVAIGERTEGVDGQGDAHVALAEVLLLGSRPVEAADALAQAVDRFDRKGNRVSAGRARARLAAVAVENAASH